MVKVVIGKVKILGFSLSDIKSGEFKDKYLSCKINRMDYDRT
ncbi:MAG: hypothetical protein ABRQ27_02440 [Clostridiaceae bacterium]